MTHSQRVTVLALVAIVLLVSGCATSGESVEEQEAVQAVEAQVEDLSLELAGIQGTMDDLTVQVDDLTTRVDDLEAQDIDSLRSDLDDVTAKVEAVCDEFFYYEGALEDIWLAAC